MLRKLLGQPRNASPACSPEKACSDADPAVRVTGIRQLSDPDCLVRLQRDDPDHRVRASAADRFRLLMTAGDESLSPKQRLDALHSSDDNTLLAHVARRARETDLRLAAVRRVAGQRLLAEVAQEDADKRVRLLAVERLTDTELLKELEQRFRRRDARLSRRARQRYQTLTTDRKQIEHQQQEADALCKELEQLIACPEHDFGARLDRLGNRRSRLGKDMPQPLAERFAKLMEEGLRIRARCFPRLTQFQVSSGKA